MKINLVSSPDGRMLDSTAAAREYNAEEHI
jgi:hypothetical protein